MNRRIGWIGSALVAAFAALALAGCTSSGGGGSDPVKATPGKGKITVTWKAVSGAESYTLAFSNDAATEASAPRQIAISGTIPDVTSPYEHDYLIYGETYTYTVKAVDAAGNSTTVGSASATPDRLPLDEIVFADAALEGCVESTIQGGGENAGANYADQILTLYDSTWCNSVAGIVDLEGIQHLTSGTAINFDDSDISDLAPMASLDLLTTLVLSGNANLADLGQLEELLSLENLTLQTANIADVSPFANLTTLKILDLQFNSISTGVATLVALVNATSINLNNTGSNTLCDDLQALIDAFTPGVVLPGSPQNGVNCTIP